MRKINDYYSKKAKKEKYPARSIYKLEEVQQKFKFLSRGDSVLDLGCFPGSWSLYAAEVVGPKGIVVGVDLQQADQVARPGGAPIHWLCQDIMLPELTCRGTAVSSGFSRADLRSGPQDHRQQMGGCPAVPDLGAAHPGAR